MERIVVWDGPNDKRVRFSAGKAVCEVGQEIGRAPSIGSWHSLLTLEDARDVAANVGACLLAAVAEAEEWEQNPPWGRSIKK